MDYIFVTGTNARGRKMFYKQYWEENWGTFDDCINLLFEINKNTGSVLVIDRSSAGRKYQKKELIDNMFWIQLSNPKVFTIPEYKKYIKIGSDEVWKAEKKLLDPNWKVNLIKNILGIS